MELVRLKSSHNKIRILTNPYVYDAHCVTRDDTRIIETSKIVKCSMANGSCVACDSGNHVLHRWVVGVIDKADGRYKVLDLSMGFFKQIQNLTQMPDLDDPTEYDIDFYIDPDDDKIRPTTNNGWIINSCARAGAKAPLPENDQKLADNVDLNSLKKLSEPPLAVTTRVAWKRALKGRDYRGSNHEGQIPWFNFDTEESAKHGARCINCNKDYPHAIVVSDFRCWACKNGY